MSFKEICISKSNALDLARFKEMDYYAVENYALPIELMMENAGLQLANLVAQSTTDFDTKILIGIENRNNGRSGLVAARRLAAWNMLFIWISAQTLIKTYHKDNWNVPLNFVRKKETILQPDIYIIKYMHTLNLLRSIFDS